MELLDSQSLYVEKNYTIHLRYQLKFDRSTFISVLLFCNLTAVPNLLAERCRVASDDFRRAFD